MKKRKKNFYRPVLKWVERRCLNLLISLAQLFLTMMMATVRVRWYGIEKLEDLHRKGIPIIYALWHQRMLIFLFTHKRQRVHNMVSAHRDGEIITRIMHRFGQRTVRGSTNRGGKEALHELADFAQKGFDTAITPDGPRGPLHKLHPGVVLLAQRTGLPLIPGAYGAHPCWQFKTWDRFILPKPFCKIAIRVGNPIWIPPRFTEEKSLSYYIELVEDALKKTTQEAEELAKTLPPSTRIGLTYHKPLPMGMEQKRP